MSVEKQKSLKLNMILNAVRGMLSVLFPLITFPYVSRVLGVENIGRYTYANSVISYFLLLSGLGIEKYAVRDGAAYREDSEKINMFAGEMFTINIISTAASYFLLFVLAVSFPYVFGDRILLIILSFQIVLKTISVDWVYSIYEDYLYITVRSILFQLVSLLCLFCFVRTADDLYIYAALTVLASAGSGILNYIRARKYVRVALTKTIAWKRHMRPIFVLFAMSLTVSIYVSSDVVVLGMLCGDKAVGIYSVSTKIYAVVKNLLGTILIVSIPRLSAQFGTGRLAEFRETANDIHRSLITVTLPAITGIILLRRPIVLLVSGVEFAEASSSLAILGVALFMCMTAWFWGQCVLVPMKRENEVFRVTLFSAVLNFVLNLFLIPRWQENAAAFTTVLAEGCTMLWSIFRGRKFSGVSLAGKTYLKVAAGCGGIVAVNAVTEHVFSNGTIYVAATVVLSAAIYAAIEFALKNEAVYSMLQEVQRLIKQKTVKGEGHL